MLRNRQGFTLIELLIVVVIIGILAAIALPKFGETRERAYVSAMQSDLRNLQTAQEMLYNTGTDDVEKYSYKIDGTIGDETPDADLNFQASDGVTITLGSITGGASAGYTATARHDAMPATYACAVSVGDPAASQSIVCAEGAEAGDPPVEE